MTIYKKKYIFKHPNRVKKEEKYIYIYINLFILDFSRDMHANDLFELRHTIHLRNYDTFKRLHAQVWISSSTILKNKKA